MTTLGLDVGVVPTCARSVGTLSAHSRPWVLPPRERLAGSGGADSPRSWSASLRRPTDNPFQSKRARPARACQGLVPVSVAVRRAGPGAAGYCDAASDPLERIRDIFPTPDIVPVEHHDPASALRRALLVGLR